jgi:fructose-bisphosphate aldolase class II
VHGVYKPGNVSLKPVILKISDFINGRFTGKPVNFVSDGIKRSTLEEIREAKIAMALSQMNIDTDMRAFGRVF